MGVPKFFRWLSERYPATSQLIAENRIPEFDCLYLDMNGIIHNCTHKDTDDPTHRISEENMFLAIFNYVEHLFGTIKPKQLFFMAIDGVAPRAKMNQQRSRRFRTALDAEVARLKAIKQGTELPKEEAFDSNCITPGTEFMAKLTQQLKYFINKKITEDVEWQGVDIILSGHEVPGEGEHKIMEYIRLAKAQPDYDANIRHCLYGLDADLIMLGLLSHDPHFCLLREEVTFGRKERKSKELEHQNFYLMHECIIREYLELEFQELKAPGALSFPFDMERVIDDFILMAFFVGNDFLPNLPNLHINEGALALMFKVYKSVLPKAHGYLNERGVINLERLALLLDELSHVEYRFFEAENADADWFRGKKMAKVDVMDKGKEKEPLVLSSLQRALFVSIKDFVRGRFDDRSVRRTTLDLPPTLQARDRKFIQDLASSVGLDWKTVEDEDGERFIRLQLPERYLAQVEDDDEDIEDEEVQMAVHRALKRYEKAPVVDVTAERAQDEMEQKYQQKFRAWKDKYYKKKLGWGVDNEEELRKMAENYVQGLQWVLFYYYRGVASWPWYYGYHYAPMISDVQKGLGANLDFQLGQPFRPFQQLMGVLPDRSKKIVPAVYHDLMSSADSPIIDFYPRDFELDMNGKKMEWEAVVKIPFIDEKRLLAAMGPRDKLLSASERARNEFGLTLKFTYAPETDFTYPSSLPGNFPDIEHCHCIVNIYELPTLEGLDIHIGLSEGVKLGEAALAGFPSLKTLPHTGALAFHGVNVFQQDSRNESMVVNLRDTEARTNLQLAKAKLGKKVHVGYPFLQEGKVVRVSDELFDYSLPESGSTQVIPVPHSPPGINQWRRKANQIEGIYSKRFGIVINPVELILQVDMLKGLRMLDDGAIIKEYAPVEGVDSEFAAQVIVDEVISEDQRFLEKPAMSIEEEFPEGTLAFFLGDFNYGRPLKVIGHQDNKAEVWVSTLKGRTPDFGRELVAQAEQIDPYMPSYAVARMLNLNPLTLSKITSSFTVTMGSQRLNLGLDLKFEARKLKVLGYSRRDKSGWSFSKKAIELIQQYMIKFPEFIAVVQCNPQGDLYAAEDFWPPESARAKVAEIQAWLKSVKHGEKVPLDAEQLNSELVMQIERAADSMLRDGPSVEGKRIKGVPRTALLKPSDAEHRLGNQRFSVGDRLVYAQDSGKVPIATRGTVVGLTRTTRTVLLDVVFDVTSMSGTSLGGRCSPFRGQTVPASSVLNLTDRQLVAGTKASAELRALPQAQYAPVSAARGGVSFGPAGYPQYVDAAPPAHLQRSWREAAAGAPPQTPASSSPNVRGSETPHSGRGRRGGLGSAVANGAQGRAGYWPSPERGRNQTAEAVGHGAPPPSMNGHSRGGGGRGAYRGARGASNGGAADALHRSGSDVNQSMSFTSSTPRNGASNNNNNNNNNGYAVNGANSHHLHLHHSASDPSLPQSSSQSLPWRNYSRVPPPPALDSPIGGSQSPRRGGRGRGSSGGGGDSGGGGAGAEGAGRGGWKPQLRQRGQHYRSEGDAGGSFRGRGHSSRGNAAAAAAATTQNSS